MAHHLPVQLKHQKKGNPKKTVMRIFKTVQVNDQIRKPNLGRNFMITEKQQAELCERIFKLAVVDMPMTGRLLRKSIFTYVEKMSLKHNFSQATQMAGRKFLTISLKNNPLVSNKSLKISIQREPGS